MRFHGCRLFIAFASLCLTYTPVAGAGASAAEPVVKVTSPTGEVWKPFGEYHIDKRLGHKMPGFGVFRCVDSHPSNPDLILMGGDTTGIWRSADAGKSWAFVSKDLPFDQVYSLRFSPSKPSVTAW